MANLCIKTPSSAILVLIFQLLVLRPRPTGQGGQVGQDVEMLGSSSQHNVLSENKRVYVSFSSSTKENVI